MKHPAGKSRRPPGGRLLSKTLPPGGRLLFFAVGFIPMDESPTKGWPIESRYSPRFHTVSETFLLSTQVDNRFIGDPEFIPGVILIGLPP